MIEKRKDYVSWDYYFMSVAFMSALRSKDPFTRNGAIIVDPKTNHIISSGYNGMPNGHDDIYTWQREGVPFTKHDFVIHSEENAILNATQSVKDCIMYLYSEKLYLPCKGCMRLIIQSGIKELMVNGLPTDNTYVYNWEATKHMIKEEGVEINVLNDPIGLFKKIKEEADKAIVMYEKVMKSEKEEILDSELFNQINKDGEKIIEDIIEKNET